VPLRSKDELFKVFIILVALVEQQFDTKVKYIRTDHGTEFNLVEKFCATCVVLFILTPFPMLTSRMVVRKD
jgi:hypothetical protein